MAVLAGCSKPYLAAPPSIPNSDVKLTVKVHPGDSPMLDVTATNISGKPLAMPVMTDWITVEVKVQRASTEPLSGAKYAPDPPPNFDTKMIPPGGTVTEVLDLRLYLWPQYPYLEGDYACRVVYMDPSAEWIEASIRESGKRVGAKDLKSQVGEVSSNAFVVHAFQPAPSVIEVR